MNLEKPQNFYTKHKVKINLVIIFIFFSIMGFLFPYTHDDWRWGTQTGLDRLQSLFVGYNGRYAGNSLILILSRSRLVKSLIYGITYTIISYLIYCICDKKSTTFFPLFIILIFTLHYGMFAQSIAWVSAFANFVMPMAFLLFLINEVYKLFKFPNQNSYKWYNYVFLCICAFISTLFIEHVTLYIAVTTVVFNAIYIFKYKKINTKLVLIFLFMLAGTILMFTNGHYTKVLAADDSTFKDTTFSQGFFEAIKKSITKFVNVVQYQLLLDHLVITVLIGIATIIILQINDNKFSNLLSFIMGLIVFYQVVKKWLPINISAFNYGRKAETIVTISFFLIILYATVKVKELTVFGLFFLYSICVLTAPLLFVNPTGFRNFFGSLIFFILLLFRMIMIIMENIDFKKNKIKGVSKASAATAAFAILLILTNIVMFSYVFYIDNTRITLAHEQIEQGKNPIEIVELPFRKYVHSSTPNDPDFLPNFKDFYNIPQEVDIEFKRYSLNWK